MANVSWPYKKLKAMSIPEVLWGLSQKITRKAMKRKRFNGFRIDVTSEVFNEK
jgi:hypothetical protein